MPKKRRVYISRVVGNQVMTSADLERLHKYMLEIEGIDHISDEMRVVVEELWPDWPTSCRRRRRAAELKKARTCRGFSLLAARQLFANALMAGLARRAFRRGLSQ
jgi:hypothetical protein